MSSETDERKGSAIHVNHADETRDLDDVVHGKEKWWNWRVLMNCKPSNFWVSVVTNNCRKVIIVGLSLGLFGYDNAFASPLVSLPLFVEKYQGPGFDGSLVFTVILSHPVIDVSILTSTRPAI